MGLVYPNYYAVGMSNLGFQSVYKILNDFEDVVCERFFMPREIFKNGKNYFTKFVSEESGRPLKDFDIVAFSISFENDYPNILSIVKNAGIPLRSIARGDSHPLLIAGGVACFLNPEPIADFIDCFLIGEGEVLFENFFKVFDKKRKKEALLEDLCRVPGAYVPSKYQPHYNNDGTLKSFTAEQGASIKVKKMFCQDLSEIKTQTEIITDNTTFDSSLLMEIGRGCPHGCRFCSAGYIYRPVRFRNIDFLENCIVKGAEKTNKIGLVGTAVSNLPGIEHMLENLAQNETRLSFSSLRADAITSAFVSTITKSGIKTATIAPDAGSEAMRRAINKGITESDVLEATEKFVQGGIPNLRVYFMTGLPGEPEDEPIEIISLTQKIKKVFLESSRIQKRIGKITISVNPFVPKPFTPFQWAAMMPVNRIKKNIKLIKKGLGSTANVEVHADSPRWANIQALFARGDRKLGYLLQEGMANNWNWAKTFKESEIKPSFYVNREREASELFPWDFIDHGIKKTYLLKEYKKSLNKETTPPCPEKGCSKCGVCEI